MTDAPGRLSAALADRYRIERELGAGGMATVYLAHDVRHDRKVALKVLRPELAAALGHERFLREITTTANLRHPHILPLYDSGEAAGFLFYVMPYVEGESLRDRLNREKQLPLDEALQMAREVSDALSYAHSRGVIHRDIKPENILLESGHAVVADFGIARAIDAAGGDRLTATGMAIGTPAYMSPEQSASALEIDGRSDTYSLGCVLYESLAGEPPYTGSLPAAIIAKRLSAPAPSIRVLRGSVPESVDRALQTAMQLTPADRYATARQFAEALRTGERPAPAAVARRWRVALGVVGAIVAAGLGLWYLRGGRIAGELDPNVIAVMPFRVGGDPAIDYLRESMLDLLNARLSGGAGPRTVEPRTTLSAWRRAVSDEREDLSEDDSRRLAAQLGAGRVLLGSAVSTPSEFTLSASLLRVSDGTTVANGSVVGTPDSVALLVNRLTAQLLILETGEARERLAGLAETSLEPLRDYLAGRKAYRRGDYFEAMELFGRAFQRDSSFAQAAFGLLMTNAWIGTVFNVAGFEAIPTVWRLREQLSSRDLGLFRGIVGPNYPGPSTYAEIIAQIEAAATEAPDSPEHWLLLGQMLSKYGAVSSTPDWPRRAADALERAIALDSSFTLAVEERLYTAMLADDRDATQRYATLLESSVVSGFSDHMMLWAAAVALGDSAAAIGWRNRVDASSRMNFVQKLVKIPLHSVRFGLSLDDARWANETLWRDGITRQERDAAWLVERAVALGEGRLVDFAAHAWDAAYLLSQALVEAPLLPRAWEVGSQNLIPTNPCNAWLRRGAQGVPWPPLRDCFAELLRVAAGDTSGAREAIRRLHEFAALEVPPIPREEWEALDLRVCPLLLETLVEGPAVGLAADGSHLDELDALMQAGPRWLTLGPPTAPMPFANLVIAQYREAQGDIPRALAAVRRRENYYYPMYLWSLPVFLRQEGWLAALAGDTIGALRAYDRYLALRTNPDPPFRPQRDSVIAERAALVSQ